MIKSRKGKVTIKAKGMEEVYSDFAVIVCAVRDAFAEDLGKKEAEELVRENVDFALMSGEERMKKIKKEIEELFGLTLGEGSEKIDE